jgi:glyoxylase I family protein
MPIETIHHFHIRAPAGELRRLLDFYCQVLGLEYGPRPQFRSLGHWLYAQGKPVVHLSQLENGEKLTEVPQRQTSFDHIAFRCTDLASTIARLKKHHVAYFMENVPLLNQTQIFLEDPSGIGVELNFANSSEG